MGFSRKYFVWIGCAAAAGSALGGCKSSNEAGKAAGAAPSAAEEATGWRTKRDALLEVGAEAPDFEALAHTGARVKLSSFLAKPVVVYFYPKDKTAGCTAEAQSIRDEWLNLKDELTMVFGVSTDSNVSHRDFATEHDLPFLLLSDSDHALADAFGVPVEDGRARRVTFLIGSDRKIVRVWEKVEAERHGVEIREALEAG